jgi:hypothetical protein
MTCSPFRVAPTIASLLLLGLTALSACGPGQADAAERAAAEVNDLIIALTPPPPTAIPVEKSQYFLTRKKTLERMRQASESHGLAALERFQKDPPALPEVQAGLLDVAAHAAPKATEALLVTLVTEFGPDPLLRREAAELLGECLPEKAIEVLEPVLRERYDDRTYPPEERMLAGWLTAMQKLRRDPVPFLALVATDLQRPMDVRHFATKALGGFPSDQGRQALEALVTESSGNGYIRRIALQGLMQSMPVADFCALAKKIQANEADTEFIVVLESALAKTCR